MHQAVCIALPVPVNGSEEQNVNKLLGMVGAHAILCGGNEEENVKSSSCSTNDSQHRHNRSLAAVISILLRKRLYMAYKILTAS